MAHLFGWRWVFLGLLPLVAIAGVIAVPSLSRLGPPGTRHPGEHRLTDGVRVAAGTALILAGLTLAVGGCAVAGHRGGSVNGLAGAGLIVLGAVIGLPALRRLVPPGPGEPGPGCPPPCSPGACSRSPSSAPTPM